MELMEQHSGIHLIFREMLFEHLKLLGVVLE